MARNMERRAARGLPPRTATDMAERRKASGWDETGDAGGGVDDDSGCGTRIVRLNTDDVDRDGVVRRVLDRYHEWSQSAGPTASRNASALVTKYH